MKMREYRQKSLQELRELLYAKRQQVLESRFRKTQGRASNVNEIRHIKKDIARILTVLRDQL